MILDTIFTKLFGTPHERYNKKLTPAVESIIAHEPALRASLHRGHRVQRIVVGRIAAHHARERRRHLPLQIEKRHVPQRTRIAILLAPVQNIGRLRHRIHRPAPREPTSLPLLLIVLVVCGVVYTNVYWFVIAAVSGHGTETGVPSGDECGRYLQNHGKVIRELSEEEYRTHLLNGDRQWTATCAVFSFLAVGVSLIPPQKGVTPPRADTPPAPSPEQVPPGG